MQSRKKTKEEVQFQVHKMICIMSFTALSSIYFSYYFLHVNTNDYCVWRNSLSVIMGIIKIVFNYKDLYVADFDLDDAECFCFVKL